MNHWIDDCLELEKFHKDKVKEFGEYKNEGKVKNRGWSVRDTARANNISHGKASDDLRLAQFFRLNPRECRKLDRKDALLYMRKIGLTKIEHAVEK